MTVTVTPVRVYTQVGTNRDLTLGTEHVTRLKRVEFTVEDAPAAPFPYLRGEWVIHSVTATWDSGSRRHGPRVDAAARRVLKGGSLGARRLERGLFGDGIPAWLAPVIEEHTPEWAR